MSARRKRRPLAGIISHHPLPSPFRRFLLLTRLPAIKPVAEIIRTDGPSALFRFNQRFPKGMVGKIVAGDFLVEVGNYLADLPGRAPFVRRFLVCLCDFLRFLPLLFLGDDPSAAITSLPLKIEKAGDPVLRLRMFPNKGHLIPILRPSTDVHRYSQLFRAPAKNSFRLL
jgi:hypothetical protein